MRRTPIALALFAVIALAPTTTSAEKSSKEGARSVEVKEGHTAEIVNGEDAPAGKWPDAAAVLFNGQQGCTGTLIAPRWAITAGHCADRDLDGVLLGTTSLARPGEGETIAVINQTQYPNWRRSYDITLLELERPATVPPRTIASGWAKFDIRNGAQAAIVGYGAIDRDGRQFVNELQEATVTITDADCTSSAGCVGDISPGGELGAGGMGTDSCGGDSGGPLYVLTPAGAFLAGATSRAYSDARYYCHDGGIYVRTDTLIPWFEEQMGEKLPVGPMPFAEDVLIAEAGDEGEMQVVHNDHKEGAIHIYAIEEQGMHGTATVGEDGVVKYEANAEYLGPDTLRVRVTDSTDGYRTVVFTMDVEVVEPSPEGCGCQSSNNGAGNALPLLLVAALLFVRRRSA